MSLELPPLPLREATDPRILAAWEQWLRALATDAEAALAASNLYDSLSPEARERWLDALAEDAPRLGIPLVAVYAPLLAVEAEPSRRARMQEALDRSMAQTPEPPSAGPTLARRAVRGIDRDGSRLVALVEPLYLGFVAVLVCRLDGVVVEATPLKPVVEELAHAVLAQSRRGEPSPEALRTFADVFSAELDEVD